MPAAQLAYNLFEGCARTMSRQDRLPEDGRELWRRARPAWRARAAEAEAPDSLEIAAYLDGRLDPAARDSLEGLLAGSPDSLDLLIAARRSLAEGSAPAAAALIERACALVPDPAPRRPRVLGWLIPLAQAFRRRERVATLALATCAVILAGLGGFELGRAGYTNTIAVEAFLAEEIDFGLGAGVEDIL